MKFSGAVTLLFPAAIPLLLLPALMLLLVGCSGDTATSVPTRTPEPPASTALPPATPIVGEPTLTLTMTSTPAPPSTRASSCSNLFPDAVEVPAKDYIHKLEEKTWKVHHDETYSYVDANGSVARNGPYATWYFKMFTEDVSSFFPSKFDSFKSGSSPAFLWSDYIAYANAVCEAHKGNATTRAALIAHGKFMHWKTDWLGHASNWEAFQYIETGPNIISAPSPPGLKHYTKYISGGGVVIVGGDAVADDAMLAARKSVMYLTSARPEYRNILRANEVRISLFGPEGDSSQLPEYKDTDEPGGFAMGMTDASMTANSAWLCYPGNWDTGGDPVIHEMIHTINHHVFEELNETYFYERIHELAIAAIEKGVFATDYSQNLGDDQEQNMTHYVGEYWAMTVEGYIMNRPGFKSSHDTREWIESNDPKLFELIRKYYPTTEWEFCQGIENQKTLFPPNHPYSD